MAQLRLFVVAMLALIPSSAALQPSYSYYGCISAPSTNFPLVVSNSPAGGLSRQHCQSACSFLGRFAALGASQCRCSVGPDGPDATFITLDDSRCTEACVADHDPDRKGVCGGPLGSDVWSVYALDDAAVHLDLLKKRDTTTDDVCDAQTATMTTVSASASRTADAIHGIDHISTTLSVSGATGKNATATTTATRQTTIPSSAAARFEGRGALALVLGAGILGSMV